MSFSQHVQGFKNLKFERKKYTDEMKDVGIAICTEAACEWLLAVLNAQYNPVPEGGADGFPVWTGMAKASFKPLARTLEGLNGSIMIDIDITPNDRVRPYEDVDARQFEGESLGDDSASRKPIIITANQYGPTAFYFRYNINVLHQYVNEYFGSPDQPRSPWHYTEIGDAAFTRYIEENIIARLPFPFSYKFLSFTDSNDSES